MAGDGFFGRLLGFRSPGVSIRPNIIRGLSDARRLAPATA